MSFMGSPPTRQRLLLEKRRKKSRQSIVKLGVLAVLLLLLLGLLMTLVLAIINLSNGSGRVSPSVEKERVVRAKRRPAPQLGLSRTFKPAPWFIAADSNRLYAAVDSDKQEVDSSGFPVDTLQAYSLADRKLVWEGKIGGHYSDLELAGNTLVTVSENLGEYTGYELRAYNAASGELLWGPLKSAVGEDVHIACDSKVVTVGYRIAEPTDSDSGYRLDFYDAASGEKQSKTFERRMASLKLDNMESAVSMSSLRLDAYEGLVVYVLYNVAGVVDTRRHIALSEYSADGYILNVQVDANSKSAYALSSGSNDDTRFVEWMPLGRDPRKDQPKSICRIESGDEHTLLLADRGYVLVAYATAGLGGVPTTKVLGFKHSDLAAKKFKPSFNYKFEAGTPADLASLPETSGEFLLALNEGHSSEAKPTGPSSLRRISLSGEATAWETARQNQAVLMLAPFKLDCLALMDGGDIKLYNAEADSIRKLKRMGYPEIGAVYSANRACLVLTAYPPEYVEGKTGLPMQVMVWN